MSAGGERTVLVRFKGDPKGVTDASAKAGKSIVSLGNTVDKFSIGVVGLAAGAAIGLEKLGESFDDAYDKIRIGTGATGDDLAKLQDSFRNVAQNVPASFGDVSTAIELVHARTGAFGETLEKLSATEIRLSQLTGTDLNTTIADSTRLFGDWSIKTADQAATLDKVFRAGQAAGVPIQSLMETVVAFGGPLRQLGFGFDESVTMLAKWEKEGVNTELVLGGLKKALGTFAKEGKDPVVALKALIAQLAGAKTSAEATQIAVKALGVKAGPDFAAAVREGRFSYADLLKQVSDGQDTITGAASATDDWKEALQKLKNKVAIDLEPAATSFFNEVTDKGVPALAGLLDWTKRNIGWLGPLAGTLGAVSLGVAGINGAVKTITATVDAWNAMVKVATIVQWAWNVALDANPIGVTILAIGAIVLGIGLIIKGLDMLGVKWSDVWGGIWGFMKDVYRWLTETMPDGIVKAFTWAGDQLAKPFQKAFDKIEVSWLVLEAIVNPAGLIDQALQSDKKVRTFTSNLPQHRAAGGGVQWGRSYIVGEAGPELWTPNAGGGSIAPNSAVGGDTYVSVQVGDEPIRSIVRAERVEADRGTRAWVKASSGVAA